MAKSVVITHLRRAGVKGRRQSKAALSAVKEVLAICLVKIADDREDPRGTAQ